MRRSRPGSAGGPPAFFAPGWRHRGYLPHLDAGDVVQMVTYRQADALPRAVADERSDGTGRRVHAVLDRCLGSCLLGREDVAEAIVSNWRRFDGVRYRLHAWVVMPNHVHVLARLHSDQSLARIVHSWKSYTAHRIRVLTGVTGRIWQPEYWDRFIRDDQHFVAAAEYIENNPVMAALVDRPERWKWSSAGEGGRAARAPS